MLTKVKWKQDAHLGLFNIAKHRVKMLQNSNLVHTAPYQACPTLQEHQHLDIEKMVSQNIVKPRQPNEQHQSSSRREKEDLSTSVSP